MEHNLYGKAALKHYDSPCHVLALDEYVKDQGRDDFSRRQVWFYVYGDEEIEEDFRKQLVELVRQKFVEDSKDWEAITIYPTHIKGKVNQHMEDLIRDVAEETGIEYHRFIERNTTIEENHEIDSLRAKIVNLEGSVDVDDVEGKSIILVDNIALSGTSLVHGSNALRENGADNVFGVCIGLGEDFPNKTRISKDVKATELLER